MKKLVFSLVALVAVTAVARTHRLTLWRGETLAARIPANIELGAIPEGISIRRGVMKPVSYQQEPDSLRLAAVYDRVVWEVAEKNAGPVVVEVMVPSGTKSGIYTSGMLEVEVLDRVLPPAREWKYYLDLWQHPWAVARLAGVKPFSKEHYAAMRPLWELLASAGQKSLTVTITDQAWNHQCRDAYHSMVEDGDFRLFDEYVAFGRSCGIGPDIACYSLCPWDLKAEPGTPEFETHWGPFMTRFAAHLREKGWFKDVVMALDERRPEQMKAVADFVQKYAPGMRVSLAGNRSPSAFKGIDIDIYSQILRPENISDNFLAEAAERRARGKITNFYVCCSPFRPNTFLDSPELEPYWIGAAPAFLGLDGFLRWAWNSWPEDPVTDGSFGAWRAGDTYLVYPGAEPSGRFLQLRNGIIAAEKVRLLAEAGKLDARAFDEAKGLFDVKRACDAKVDLRKVLERTNALVNR